MEIMEAKRTCRPREEIQTRFLNKTYLLETGGKEKSDNRWPLLRSSGDYSVKESKEQMFHYYSFFSSFHAKLGMVYAIILALNRIVMN